MAPSMKWEDMPAEQRAKAISKMFEGRNAMESVQRQLHRAQKYYKGAKKSHKTQTVWQLCTTGSKGIGLQPFIRAALDAVKHAVEVQKAWGEDLVPMVEGCEDVGWWPIGKMPVGKSAKLKAPWVKSAMEATKVMKAAKSKMAMKAKTSKKAMKAMRSKKVKGKKAMKATKSKKVDVG